MSESSSRKGNPISWDWTTNPKYVNPIRDQNTADCCSSFAICGVLEIVLGIEKKLEHISLSPKDIFTGLIKENKDYEKGCTIPKAIEWAKSNGCVLERSCPYVKPYNQTVNQQREVYLKFDTTEMIDLREDLAFKKEKDKAQGKKLESRIVIAPVAAQMLWFDEMNNLKGDVIYSGPKSAEGFGKKDEYHAVVIVGYGQEMKKNNLIKYWIVRNSHGVKWGNGGYAKINRAPSHGRLLIEFGFIIKGIEICESVKL